MNGRMITALVLGALVSAVLFLRLNAHDPAILPASSAHDLIVGLAGLAGSAVVPAGMVGIAVASFFALQRRAELIPLAFGIIFAATFAAALAPSVITTSEGRVRAAVNAFVDRRNETIESYDAAIRPYDIDATVEPGRLAQPGGVKAALEALASHRRLTAGYYEHEEADLGFLEAQLAALDARHLHRRRATRLRTKVDDYIANSHNLQSRLRQAELSYLDARRDWLLFMQARAGHWRVGKDSYLWDNEDDIRKISAMSDRTTTLLQQLRVLHDRQTALDTGIGSPN